MESIPTDPQEISIGTINGLDTEPIVVMPRDEPPNLPTPRDDLMKRVEEVAQSGRHMRDELTELRTQTSQRDQEDFANRHRRRGELLEKFRRDLALQREGMTTTLNQILDQIHQDPNQSALALFEIANQGSQTYHFDIQQLNAIAEGLLEYEKKHQAVEKAAAEYPSPTEFFTANFGFSPQGKVEVIKGPMTINFRCYALDDYQATYAGSREQLTDDNKARSSSSGGFASPYSRIPGLAGTIIVENISANKDNWVQKHVTQEIDLKSDISFGTANTKEAAIQFPSGLTAALSFEDLPTQASRPYEFFQRVKVNTNDSSPTFDVVEVIVSDGQGFQYKYRDFMTYTNPENQSDRIQYSLEDCQIELKNGQLLISPTSPIKMKVTFGSKELVYDPDLAHPNPDNYIVHHEEQHQFNKLFATYEPRVVGKEILYEVLAKRPLESERHYHDVSIYDSIVAEVATRLARNYRGNIADPRARDEIIAYYRDGRSVNQILTILSETEEGVKNSPKDSDRVALYDYATQRATEIKQLPEKIIGTINLYEKEIVAALNLDSSSAIPPTQGEIKQIVKKVFGPEYQQDLRSWISSITSLENKGYSRQEVLALLYQYPAYRWHNLARQMPDKNKTAA